jgi:hypothetical protein
METKITTTKSLRETFDEIVRENRALILNSNNDRNIYDFLEEVCENYSNTYVDSNQETKYELKAINETITVVHQIHDNCDETISVRYKAKGRRPIVRIINYKGKEI